MSEKRLIRYFNQQTATDRWTIAIGAVERLIELGEVEFRIDDIDVDEGLFWKSSGEDMRVPF